MPNLYLPKRILNVIVPNYISIEELKSECLKAFKVLGKLRLESKCNEKEFLTSIDNCIYYSNPVKLIRNYIVKKEFI